MPLSMPTSPTGANRAGDRGWLLVLAMVPLFASAAFFHVPLVLMAIGGLLALVREGRTLRDDPAMRFILALFLCLWVPQIVALTGAVVPVESLRVSGRYLLYPLAAVFIARAMRSGDRFAALAMGVAAVVALWGADLVAGALGWNVGAAPAEDAAYVGGALFGRDSLAHVAAAVSPLVFELIRRRHREAPWLWIGAVLLVLLVVLSGRRVAWIMLLFSGAAYAAYFAIRIARVRWRWVLVLSALVVATSLLAYTQHGPTEERVLVTLDLLSPDVEEVDRATSWRLGIWRTASATTRAHWPLGVGARGFRHVYEDHAPPGDFWLEGDRTGALHPHQFTLEIAAETGLAGLLGYLLAWWFLGVALLRGGGAWAWPCGLVLALTLLPVNAHLAFYGSYWSAVIWWAIGITAAAIRPVVPPSAPSP